MTETCRVLLVSGALKKGSTNTAALCTARAVAPAGVEPVLYEGLGELPHFNPDDDAEPLDRAIADLRAAIRGADAVVFSTPEYAGALPGSFKNALDWTIGDGEAGSMHGKPVGWVNSSPRGGAGAHESLRAVLGYAGAVIVEDACVDVPVTSADLGDDGLVADVTARDRLAGALAALAAAAGSPR